MLNKLLKYDLKWINKVLIVYYIILLIIGILTRCSLLLSDSTINIIIRGILRGTFIGVFCSTIINALMRLWARFNLNIYKDESYLTHTLPVKRGLVFDSKILSGIFVLALSLLLILFSADIAFLELDIDATMDFFRTAMGINNPMTIIKLIIIFFLELLAMMLCGIFGLILGHKSNNGKMIKSVLVGIITYMIIQMITLMIMYFISLYNPLIAELYGVGLSSHKALKLLVNITLILYFIYDLSLYIMSRIMFIKGIDVE